MVFPKPFWRELNYSGNINFAGEYRMNELVELSPPDLSCGIVAFVFLHLTSLWVRLSLPPRATRYPVVAANVTWEGQFCKSLRWQHWSCFLCCAVFLWPSLPVVVVGKKGGMKLEFICKLYTAATLMLVWGCSSAKITALLLDPAIVSINFDWIYCLTLCDRSTQWRLDLHAPL